jgi:hypothetical protein
MEITDNGSVLDIDGKLQILKQDIGHVKINSGQERVTLINNSKPKVFVLRYADITSPVFAAFSDFSDWIDGARLSSGQPIDFVVDAGEATTDTVDISGYNISTIRFVFVNNAFIPSSDYTFDSAAQTLAFDVNLNENDIVTVYEG